MRSQFLICTSAAVASAALLTPTAGAQRAQLVAPQAVGGELQRVTVEAPRELSGRRLQLVPSAPVGLATAGAPSPSAGAPGIASTGLPAGLVRTQFQIQTGIGLHTPSSLPSAPVAGMPGDGAGCETGVASPAIGADVPETYFGVPSPGTNPSLVGAVQLLTAGELDLDERTITLPFYEGVLFGSFEKVWYISTDTTDESNAQSLGINFSGKLVFGETGDGARTATLTGDGLLVFDQGAVDFSPVRSVTPNFEPNPFPPAAVQPGSVGDHEYSPLVKLENAGGHIYNMPVLAMGPGEDLLNADGTVNHDKVHDAVVAIDFENETVTLELASGFSFGRPVLYLSTDSNSPVAAALEGATLAPGLDDIDVGNDDSLFSAVERIFITVNGARGCDNPQRQGLDAALTDGASPFNVLGGIPTVAGDYSPLWDANFGEWTPESIQSGYRSRVIDEFQILSFVDNGFMTGPGGTDYGSSGVIINCPIVHRFL